MSVLSENGKETTTENDKHADLHSDDLSSFMSQALKQIESSDWLQHNAQEKFKAENPEVIEVVRKDRNSTEQILGIDMSEILSHIGDSDNSGIIHKSNELSVHSPGQSQPHFHDLFPSEDTQVIAVVKQGKEAQGLDLSDVLSSMARQSENNEANMEKPDMKQDIDKQGEEDLCDLMGQALQQIENSDWLQHNTAEKFKRENPEVIAEVKKIKDSGEIMKELNLPEMLSHLSSQSGNPPYASTAKEGSTSSDSGGDDLLELMKQVSETLRHTDLSTLANAESTATDHL